MSGYLKREDQRLRNYVASMRAVFRKRAVYSDETSFYRSPFEPKPGDLVRIRIRTYKNNVDEVWFISGALRSHMEKKETRECFDYYEISITCGEDPIIYYFELKSGNIVYYYNKIGVTRDLTERHAFRIHPGFSTPEWARGTVMYQIYTDRFANGDRANDVLTDEYAYLEGHSRHIDDWYAVPEDFDVRNFYGGDIEGIEQKLDYLEDLGVEVLYLNPIFVSPSNHKYDIQDYDHVDPHFSKIIHDGGDLLAPGDMDNQHAGRYIKRVTDTENLAASDAYFVSLWRRFTPAA